MSSAVRIALYGALAIVAWDVMASVASRALGFPYSYATVGSWGIYAVVAVAVGRRATIRAAIAATVLVGLVEATLGWWFSWIIGPGRTATGTVTTAQVAGALLFVAVVAGVIGTVGGAIGRAKPDW